MSSAVLVVMNTLGCPLPLSLRLVALAAALVAAPACSHVEPVRSAEAPLVAAGAASAAGVRLGPSRTLSDSASLRHPVLLQAANGDVAATFTRHRGGAHTVTLAPETLETRGELESALPTPPHATAFAPYEGGRVASAALEGGRRLAVWTDPRSGRVLGQLHSREGARVGSPFEVSRSADVVGSPVVATADGHRVVTAFFTSVGEGFALVAVSLDVESEEPRGGVEALRRALHTPPGVPTIGAEAGMSPTAGLPGRTR